jgi:hypothetical protein
MVFDSNMGKHIPIKKYVEDVLLAGRLAVLATERDGQPYMVACQ